MNALELSLALISWASVLVSACCLFVVEEEEKSQ